MIRPFRCNFGCLTWSLSLGNWVCLSVHDACFSRSQHDYCSCRKHPARFEKLPSIYNFTLMKIMQMLIFYEITVLLCNVLHIDIKSLLLLFYQDFFFFFGCMAFGQNTPVWPGCFTKEKKTDGYNVSALNVFQNSNNLIWVFNKLHLYTRVCFAKYVWKET